ncbi:hypothetical protein Zmor_014795 [Zophobas morio]|uniref:Transcription factor Adf-1 n=1 Tax=Zophobas morio TaxID=2755281 RepID=A0AA38MH55_9CUCU|nr:hypothetical protein Zmor_014795 [Zophobas morio]
MSNSSYRVDADEYLVSLIAKHPGIYDKRSDYYKDYIRKQQSWDSIASQLNLDAESVRKRWENLRDRFVRVYREYTASSNNPMVKNKFKLFDHMLWLAPHIRKRRMTSSVFVMKTKVAPQFSLNDDTQSSDNHETKESVNVKAETQSNASDITYHESYLEDDAMLSSTSAADGISQPTESEIPNKSDHYFMMSVVHDCQAMRPRKKLKFKKDVLELLEKYLYDDDK